MQDDADAAFIAGADAAPVVVEKSTNPEPDPEPAKEAEAVAEGDKPAEPEGEKTEPEPDEKPKQTPWFQKRIDDLTREKYEARREAEALREYVSRLSQQQPAPQEGEQPRAQQPVGDPVEIAKQQIRQEQAVAEFNRTCNDIYDVGTKEFSDFGKAIDNFRMLGGLPPALIEAAVEAGDPHKVLYQLGNNPDEAARVLALPPARMGAALAKIVAKAPAPTPKAVSAAPAPIKPVAGAGGRDDGSLRDDLPMAEWIKRHDALQAGRR
jgi:hypothetical protein